MRKEEVELLFFTFAYHTTIQLYLSIYLCILWMWLNGWIG